MALSAGKESTRLKTSWMMAEEPPRTLDPITDPEGPYSSPSGLGKGSFLLGIRVSVFEYNCYTNIENI